jgi:hypothetical protein
MKTATARICGLVAGGALLVWGGFLAGRSTARLPDQLLASVEGVEVARWSGGRLTRGELDVLIAAEPPLTRSRLQDGAQREAYVREVVGTRLVAQEAVRQGLLADATMRQALIARLAQALREREFSPEVVRSRLEEAEVTKAFEARAPSFAQPEKARLVHLFLAAKQGTAERAHRRGQALSLLYDARKHQRTDSMVLGRVASQTSDELASRSRAGDLGYVTRDQLVERYGAGPAEAAWGLAEAGAVSDLVETPEGFHLFQLQARSRARTARLEDVRSTLEAELVSTRQAQGLTELTRRLVEAAGVQLVSASAP